MISITAFDIIAKSFKIRNDKPVIDDYIFQCHYKLTTNILLTFCLLVTSINLIGQYLFKNYQDYIKHKIMLTIAITYETKSNELIASLRT